MKNKITDTSYLSKGRQASTPVQAVPNDVISVDDTIIFQQVEEEKAQLSAELIIANKELVFQNEEKEKRADELIVANIELAFQNKEKASRAEELIIANKELVFQNEEKEKRAAELIIANIELAFQNKEKASRAQELIIANKELVFQNEEKEKRAAELTYANNQLACQNANHLKETSDYKHVLDESFIVAITDLNGIITHVNKNFCTLSGYAIEELVGSDHRITNPEFHSQEFVHQLWATIGNGKTWRAEIKNKAKDGSIYWVDKTIIPFLDEKGQPYKYAAVGADITLRKQAEEEVQHLTERLEERVRERTADLESFSYSVSHDLRAPLRAVNGYARMFKGQYANQFDQEANRLVNNIIDNAAKMGRLIDDLLDFSRVGRRDMNMMELPMEAIVKHICLELQKEETKRDIQFNIGPLLPAKGDNIGIKQVWLNLISNAIKYSSSKNNAVIEIGSEVRAEETIYFVKDNGVGFDMRYVDKLFGMFQRLHSEEEFEGTGVGLAIVQRIIQKHGGRVWAEGEVGEKAIFYFSLNTK